MAPLEIRHRSVRPISAKHAQASRFLQQSHNKRTDEYGGSFQNRARFWLETLEMVKSAVGDDCAIATRMSITPEGPVGVGMEECLAFVELADHAVDLWDVNIGTMAAWSLDSGPSRFVPQGHQLAWSSQVQAATTTPVVGVGRMTDPDEMARIIRTGNLALIGAARPSIADPFLPKKIENGQIEDVRECIGCNVCIATANTGHMSCTQNPTIGEEFRRGWHPERVQPATNSQLPILIVGAGPAGLECARVLGQRGFDYVHVVDAGPEVGGAMRWMSQLPGLGEWARVWEWRHHQLTKLRNVQVEARRRLSADDILDYGAEYVILATGSTWAGDGLDHLTHEPIPGCDAEMPHTLTPEQVMLHGKRPPGERVLLYDSEGYFVGSSLAELLASEGYAVDFVTPFATVAPFASETLESGYVTDRLARLQVSVHVRSRLSATRPGSVVLEDQYGSNSTFAASGTVLVTQRRSEDSIYHALLRNPERLQDCDIKSVLRVGDCVAPRLIADAVFDGARLGRELEGPHPAVPLPYDREEPVPPGST